LQQHGGEEQNPLGIQPNDESISTNQGQHEALMEIMISKAFIPLFEGCSTNMNCQPCSLLLNLRTIHGNDNVFMDGFLLLWKEFLPKGNNLPTTTYEANKLSL
jgi:hypothetical protein